MSTGLHRLIAVLVAVTVAAATGGCTASGADDELVVYSGRSRELVEPILERFHEDTGIDIAVRYGGSAEMALLIAEEAAGGRVQADVFFSQSPGAVGFLAEQDLLAPLPEAVLARVPERFRSAAGRWVGVSGRQRVLVYNRDLVPETDLPTSVFELTDPRYAGRVALAPSNGSFQDFVSIMRQTAGDEATLAWLQAMADGGAPTYANNNAIVEAVSRGEVPMGLVNHYYNLRFLAENPDLPSRNHVLAGDDPGAAVIPSTLSLVAGSERADAAVRLVDFLLSAPAQEYFADETFEYPLAAGVQPAAGLPPLDTLEAPPVDIDRLGGELEGTVELLRRSGLAL
jgi:iron(III) transport system substrate-binding protein